MFYRRTDNGRWIMCRAVSMIGAKREASVIYRFGRDESVWEISCGDDKVVVSQRIGPSGKWRDITANDQAKGREHSERPA